MQINSVKLTLKEKIGYSLGETASNLFFQTFMLFLLYFYTDVFGIPAAVVGTIILKNILLPTDYIFTQAEPFFTDSAALSTNLTPRNPS